MNDQRRGLCFSLVLTAHLIGCGSTPPPAPEAPVEAPREASSGPVGPSVESEIGALDDTKVKQTFEHLSGRLTTCFTDGARDIAFMSGDVRFVVRIAKDGSARWVYVKDSTLGHRKTEECMTSALKAASWPKPLGGEGIAENSFSFDPGSEERPPVAWTPERLGPQRKKALAKLDQCRKKAGTKSLKATMYIDTDGSVSAVGISSGDEKGQGAADCVVAALKSLKYPSPGSYAAKVTVATE